MRTPGAVAVDQPGLAAVGPGQPAEEVVEGAVLHHDDDDVVDSRAPRSLRSPRQSPPGHAGTPTLRAPSAVSRAAEELATREGAIVLGPGAHRAVKTSVPKERRPGAAA